MENSDVEQATVSNLDSNPQKKKTILGRLGAKIAKILCYSCRCLCNCAWFVIVVIPCAICALVTGTIEVVLKLMKLPFVWILPKWKKIFVISCVFAVLLDPLFLYIPIIKQDMKCIEMDKTMNKIAFALRSLTDFSYFLDIIAQFYDCRKIWHPNILIDISAILPLPQAVILIFFSKGRGALSTWTKLMNSLALLQYVPRVLRIFFSCKELKKTPDGNIKLWIKGVYNFFLYILASHVLGAFWYFFAIQRMTNCWRVACRTDIRCKSSTLVCKYDELKNATYLDDLCPINPPNATLFDLGIFSYVLESGISESTDHPKKFANCFWWGLRNLSSLGSNLEASVNTWENLFAAFISIIGLLLFLYLIGNLQVYMQSDASRVAARKHEIKIQNKVDEKGRDIALWLSSNFIIPHSSKDNIKSQIMRKVKQEIEEHREVDVGDILTILPSELQTDLNDRMIWKTLKRVPKLERTDEVVLKEMCKHLTPKKYPAYSDIIGEKEPLGMMLLIVEGEVEIKSSSSDEALRKLGTGHFYGEELLDWVNVSLFPALLPLSTTAARAITDVEVRILMASDLCSVAAFFCEHFPETTFTSPPEAVRFNRLGLHGLHIENGSAVESSQSAAGTLPN